jgi:class 3 adenylate cyclase
VVDFDALEAAGIANARGRASLIDYLDKLGFTTDEMVEAERNGRLFGLAGDSLQGPGRPIHSLRTAAEVLEVPLSELAQAWAVMGLTISDPEALALSQADIDGLTTWVAIKDLVGSDAAVNFLRVLGNTMARLAEAGGTMARMATPDLLMSLSGDELTTAMAYR